MFSGRGTDRQASIVVVDLANFSGFYEVTGPEDRDSLSYREGMRSVFARIFNFMHFTEEERRLMGEMVRLERQADEQTRMGNAEAS